MINLSNIETKKLIKACQRNDRVSQNTIFKMYSNLVMNIAKRYTQDDYSAKDVFLRTFEKAFARIDQFDQDRGNFKSWITKITVNESLTLIRKNKKYQFTNEMSVLDSAQNADVFDKLDVEYLHEIIKTLQYPYSVVFNMVIDGYKHKEIAFKLKIRESTSRSYFLRARNMLKKEISKQELKRVKWS